jgi:hypothetical protein
MLWPKSRPVPSHVVFRPSDRPIRIRNEARSHAESQREWLQRRLRQAACRGQIMTSENQPLFAGANVDLFCHSGLRQGWSGKSSSRLGVAASGGPRLSGDRQTAASRRISRLSKSLGLQIATPFWPNCQHKKNRHFYPRGEWVGAVLTASVRRDSARGEKAIMAGG